MRPRKFKALERKEKEVHVEKKNLHGRSRAILYQVCRKCHKRRGARITSPGATETSYKAKHKEPPA